jgi:hypothetical protein
MVEEMHLAKSDHASFGKDRGKSDFISLKMRQTWNKKNPNVNTKTSEIKINVW